MKIETAIRYMRKGYIARCKYSYYIIDEDGCLILLNKNNLTKKGVATITGDAFLTDDWEVWKKYREEQK